MSRSERISRIVALKRLDEVLAARQLMSARQSLTRGQQIHADLVNYLDHYSRRSSSANQRQDSSAMVREREFSGQLSKAIEQQQIALRRQGEQVDQEHRLWTAKRTRSLATEALLKRVHEDDAARQERIAAVETDEMAQRIHRSGQR